MSRISSASQSPVPWCERSPFALKVTVHHSVPYTDGLCGAPVVLCPGRRWIIPHPHPLHHGHHAVSPSSPLLSTSLLRTTRLDETSEDRKQHRSVCANAYAYSGRTQSKQTDAPDTRHHTLKHACPRGSGCRCGASAHSYKVRSRCHFGATKCVTMGATI